MSDTYIAVEGCQLTPVEPATGEITITSVAYTEVLINGKGVYFKEIAFSVADSNGGGSVTDNNGIGEGKIVASYDSITNTQDGIMLKGDNVDDIPISGTSGGESASGSISVEITDTGQTDVTAI